MERGEKESDKPQEESLVGPEMDSIVWRNLTRTGPLES
jgi:hypothetical protein